MLIILVLLSLLGWLYLTQASHVATTGRRVQALEREQERLEEENLQIVAEIAQLESVSRLAARAEELGFVAVDPGNAQFLVVDELPRIYEDETTDTSVVDRLLDGVADQFTAWAQSEGR
jgi:hypothetical protein